MANKKKSGVKRKSTKSSFGMPVESFTLTACVYCLFSAETFRYKMLVSFQACTLCSILEFFLLF